MAKSLYKAVLLAGVVNAFSIQSVYAQDQAAPAENEAAAQTATDEDGSQLELQEIIVTAQKRSQNLQNVPISVGTVSAEELERIDSVNVGDFARRVPGVSFRSRGPGDNDIVIRGISSSATTSRQTTGFYIDETPVSAFGLGATIDVGLFDLDRIEVLRGPQGTLYGAGSMGGTVRLITGKPDYNEASGRADVTAGTTRGGAMSYGTNGLINLPISPNIALRAVGFARHDGGWIDKGRPIQTFNPYDPNNYQIDPAYPVEKNVNDVDTVGARVVLGIKATERLTITPSIFYQKMVQDHGLTQYDEQFDEDTHERVPGTERELQKIRSIPERLKDSFTLYNMTVNYEAEAFEVVSSSSYFRRRRHDVEDISTTPLYFFYNIPFGNPQRSLIATPYEASIRNNAFVQEVRASTTGDGPFRLVIGGFYSNNKVSSHNVTSAPGFSEIVFPIPATDTLPADVFQDSLATVKTKEKALFGELSYDIIPTLTATVGLRAFKSTSTTRLNRQGFAFSGPLGGILEESSSDSGITPKFLLSWQATPTALVYATAAKGFRPGGANPPVSDFCAPDLEKYNLTSLPTSFEPDSLWSYEVGAKTRLLNNRLTVNAAAYHVDWKNIQQQIDLPCGFGFFGNFGSARSQGAELEVSALLAEGLTVTGGASYTDAKLTSAGIEGLPGLAGDRLQNTPRWTATAGIDYVTPLTDSLSAGATLDFQYRSSEYGSFDPGNPDYLRSGYSMFQLNLRLFTDRYQLSLFVNNLTDTKAVTAYSGTKSLNIPGMRIVVPVRPRMIGLKLGANF